MKSCFVYALIGAVFLNGCKEMSHTDKTDSEGQSGLPVREYSVQAVLWQQNAAEYKALCYQAFNTAKVRLDNYLADHEADENLAIITDIDETVMDNSFLFANLIERDEEYDYDEWYKWTKRGKATAVPGALKFLNYAKRKGVEIFYVSNRNVKEEDITLKNMEDLEFPYADKDHLLFEDGESKKKPRFDKVGDEHEVVLFMGDNLSDFSSKFRTPSTEKRNTLADEKNDKFGKKFIVLPNPMYGDWENQGIYEGKSDWTDAEKDSIRKAKLKAY